MVDKYYQVQPDLIYLEFEQHCGTVQLIYLLSNLLRSYCHTKGKTSSKNENMLLLNAMEVNVLARFPKLILYVSNEKI